MAARLRFTLAASPNFGLLTDPCADAWKVSLYPNVANLIYDAF